MTRIAQGGTNKWCPHCKEITICTAVNPSQFGERSGQRWYREEYEDIQWFRRGLICQNCGTKWLTAEVEEKFLDELTELRDALGDIKLYAEDYINESEKASISLKKLSGSLKVLKALKIYKNRT